MRILDYKERIGLTLDEIKARFGVPSPYRDSKNATLVVGANHRGEEVKATMVIFEEEDALVICSIRAMNSGGGSMLMQKICDMADEYGVPIIDLHPSPFSVSKDSVGVRKLRKQELVAFYQRFGFQYGRGLKMYRLPKVC